MKAFDVFVQSCAAVNELLVYLVTVSWNGIANLIKRLCDLLHDLSRREVGPVEVNGQVAEAYIFQSPKHDFQSGALFGNKENTVTRCSQSCDKVSNRLTFSSSGRSVYDGILTGENVRNRALLT